MKNSVALFWLAAILVLILAATGIFYISQRPGKLDAFAACIKNSGAVFYGAFWCPHCQATKALFGRSAKLLPYVECSTPDGKGQLPACTEKGVTSYPTWIFTTGEVATGELSLARIAEATSCPLPQ